MAVNMGYKCRVLRLKLSKELTAGQASYLLYFHSFSVLKIVQKMLKLKFLLNCADFSKSNWSIDLANTVRDELNEFLQFLQDKREEFFDPANDYYRVADDEVDGESK